MPNYRTKEILKKSFNIIDSNSIHGYNGWSLGNQFIIEINDDTLKKISRRFRIYNSKEIIDNKKFESYLRKSFRKFCGINK